MTDRQDPSPDETRRSAVPQTNDAEPTIDPTRHSGADEESVGGSTADSHVTAPLATVGHFELYRQIGQGGMGTVYRAFDTRLRRDIAVKVLTASDDGTVSTQGKQRFVKEAQITGQLQHPGIPRSTNWGRSKTAGPSWP